MKLSGSGRIKPANIALLGMVVLALVGAAVLTYTIIEDAVRIARPSPSAEPPPPPAQTEPTEPQTPTDPLDMFDAERALAHVHALAVDIGVRGGGSAAEIEAADYIERQFAEIGYDVRRQSDIAIPVTGLHTSNVVAVKPPDAGGREDLVLVVGAHYDSVTWKEESPGANDNASGVGVMIEIARTLKDYPLPYSVHFVAFGAEEMQNAVFENHHYGSRHYVEEYLAGDKQPRVFGMLSVDMVGVGDTLYARTLGGEKSLLLERAQAAAERLGLGLPLKPDARGESDHEPFARAGIPAVWIERLPDPDYHTTRDRYENVDATHLRTAGRLVLRLMTALSAQDAEELAAGAPTPPPQADAAEQQPQTPDSPDLPPPNEGLVIRVGVSGTTLVATANASVRATINPAAKRGEEPVFDLAPGISHTLDLDEKQARKWAKDRCMLRLWREGDRLHFEATPRTLAVYINKRSTGTTKILLSSLGGKPARIGFYFPANDESGYTVALVEVDPALLPER